jgi:hypothetical protein
MFVCCNSFAVQDLISSPGLQHAGSLILTLHFVTVFKCHIKGSLLQNILKSIEAAERSPTDGKDADAFLLVHPVTIYLIFRCHVSNRKQIAIVTFLELYCELDLLDTTYNCNYESAVSSLVLW